MTKDTHKIIALKVLDNFNLNKNQGKEFLIGNTFADFIPHYAARQHYPQESMGHVLTTDKRDISLFKLGALSHLVSDFLCTPHFNNWRLYSLNAINHIKFEKKLEEIAYSFSFPLINKETNKTININDEIKELCEFAKEDYEENLRAAYIASSLMVENFIS